LQAQVTTAAKEHH